MIQKATVNGLWMSVRDMCLIEFYYQEFKINNQSVPLIDTYINIISANTVLNYVLTSYMERC